MWSLPSIVKAVTPLSTFLCTELVRLSVEHTQELSVAMSAGESLTTPTTLYRVLLSPGFTGLMIMIAIRFYASLGASYLNVEGRQAEAL